MSGRAFSVSGEGNLPVTVSAGGTYSFTVNFTPTAGGATTGQLTITSNSSGGSSTVVSLSGTGLPALSTLSCTNGSMTGAGTDSCKVTLNAAAASGGFAVSLASNNPAVTVPASVTVATGATSASFTATVSSVSTSQAVTLTASANSVTKTFALQLSASVITLGISSSSLSFGNVNVNSASSQTLTLSSTGTTAVTVSAAGVTGSGFTVSGVTFPLTLNPNKTATLTVKFAPAAAGPATGQLTLTSNSSTGSSTVVSLSGTGLPVLSALSCTNGSITGAGTDSCTVTLNAAAASGGFTVGLASNNSAVTVPASVIVAAGATTAGFTAAVAAVSTAQAVTLTASANSVTKTFALQLGASVSTLSVSSSSLSFGNVNVNAAPTQTLILSSTGTAAVTVSAATVTGTGFAISGGPFPLTLNPNQTAMLTVQFAPSTAGVATGQLTLTSNSSTGPSTVVGLSGTGLPVLSALSCTSGSITGAGTDSCTVTLNAAAASSGFTVSLASNNSAVTVPASVTIAAGATSAGFTATVAAVSNAQAVTLTASANSVTQTFGLQLAAVVPTLSTLSCSSGSLTGAGTDSCTVTLNIAAPSGGFAVSLASNNSAVTIPASVTVAANATSASFTATVTAVSTAQAATLTATANSVTLTFGLQLNIGVPTLTALSCSSGSLTGAGTDSCTVTLNIAAPSGGFAVSPASNNSAVTVPASLTVAANATSASFTATVTAVSTAQAVTLTASANSVTQTFNLQLGAAVPTLSVGAGSIGFGNVTVNSPATQSVTLSSTGTAQVTVSSAAVAGTGFTISGVTFPLNLNPNQTTTLSVQFDPTATGASTGQLTITSNSSSGSSTLISLSGTGVPVLSGLSCTNGSMTGAGTDACTVTLSAAAPSSGYNVNLSSSSSTVSVPASVTVASGSTSAGFTATVSAYTSSQSVTLTATDGIVTETTPLQLNLAGGGNGGHYYTTNFASPPAPEDPISESGNWINGGTTGLKWGNVQTSPGLAFGTLVNGGPPYNDNTAVLTGTWGPNQTAQATLSLNNSSDTSSSEEVELHLNTSITANNITGYEFDASVMANSPYLTIVRWNGTLNSYTVLSSTVPTVLHNGDVLLATNVNGVLTLYDNGVVQVTATDTTYSKGSPGIGFWNTGGPVSNLAHYGFSSFTASDGTTSDALASSGMTCASGSMTGSGTDACTITLSSAAPSGGLAVSLTSNNSAVTVPATVTVPANATSATVTATVAAVTTAQTATLTASANGVTASFALQLSPVSAALTINTASVAFGDVTLNSPATQSLILSSTGTAAVTVSGATVTGADFTDSGLTFPLTLNPNQTATLSVQFDPSVMAAETGQLTITSNSSSGTSNVINLSGTGVASSYEASLSWDAPTSSTDPVAGYNVYRALSGSITYEQLNSAAVTQTTYVDTNVQNGQTYDYIVESVDALGVTSDPSNMTSIAIP